MFTFDSRLRYTHTYNVENVQKNTFNFKKKKKRDQFMESKNNISKWTQYSVRKSDLEVIREKEL